MALAIGCDDGGSDRPDSGADARPIDDASDAMPDAVVPPPSDWTCLAMPPAPTTVHRTLHAIVEHRTAQRPVAGAQVRVCRRDDPECAMPVARTTTDASGVIDVALPEGDLGYIAIEADGFQPIDFYATRGLDDFVSEPPFTLQLIDDATKDILLQLAEITLDPERGHLLFDARDCIGRLSAGVEVTASTSDDRSQRVYVSGPFPDAMARDTDTSGLGAIFNLPIGMTRVTAVHTPTGTTIATIDVHITPGYASEIFKLSPTAP